jgi:methyltransferase (TIGR00027 family)
VTTPPEALAAVGRTAFGVAAARAAESARHDRLFADPLADLLLDAGGPETRAFWTDGGGARLSTAMGDYIALRTRYFDDQLSGAVAAGCRQVVLVAAGLDTRAFRLELPVEGHVFELDQPAVLEVKGSVLADAAARPRCTRTQVGVDLRGDWRAPLLHAGFRRDLPTCWLVEGLLVYLTSTEADDLLDTVTGLSERNSWLVVEHTSRPALEGARVAAGGGTSAATALLASLWRNDSPIAPAEWLDSRGWRANHGDPGDPGDLADLAARHRRPVPPVFDPGRAGTARVTLLSARFDPLSEGGGA